MATIDKKELPIGIQTFATVRKGNYYYVDKTQSIVELAKQRTVFLSRPRRFGKSLTIDTLAELFSGNKALFKGLYAESNWDWETVYPVIRLGFAEGKILSRESLAKEIHAQLEHNEQKYQLSIQSEQNPIHERFRSLIEKLSQQNGKVVILIDEYDKPMLDNINTKAITSIRDALHGFYSVVKGQEANIRFAMLTGVSKFSKVNIFSGLNSLNDITLDKKYSAICGYTQTELQTVFAPELEGVDLAELKCWYNGYNWTGEAVYNPFDILLFLKEKVYQAYWFETGSSSWLVDNLVINKLNMHNIRQKSYSSMDLAKFDIDQMSPIAILFQAGYLTIDTAKHIAGMKYTLKYPNVEVQQSLNQVLLQTYFGDSFELVNRQVALYEHLQANDWDKVKQVFQSFFASIPHQWYTNNDMANYEGHWASVFYGFLSGLGVAIQTEDSTSHGRMDLSFEFDGCVYIVEFKVVAKESQADKQTTKAIEQIINKGYADKYLAEQADINKPIYLMGVVFASDERNLVGFGVRNKD